MPNQKKRLAEAVAEVRSPETGQAVGWLYLWDDGTESQILYIDVPPGLLDCDHVCNDGAQLSAGTVLSVHVSA